MYSSISDGLLVVTVVGYLVAMAGYSVEFAFGRQGVVARVAARSPRRERVLVGPDGGAVPAAAGAGTADTLDDDSPDGPALDGTARDGSALDGADDDRRPPIGAERAATIGRLALAVQTVAALAHLGCLVFRALAAHRVPWGNMYEYVLTACLIATVAWLVTSYRRPSVRHLGVFVSLLVAILLCIDVAKLYATAGPLVPALNSYWLWIHVSAMTLASGIFLVGFVAIALHLIQERREAWLAAYDGEYAAAAGGRGGEYRPLRFPFTLGERLPRSEVLERLGFRIHALAFPVWTFGIMCGAIWAEHAWGRYWGWDPKETWSFISWVVYAAYLHARATPSIRGRWSSLIAMVGWATMLVNLFGVNLVVSGLHSYAGVG